MSWVVRLGPNIVRFYTSILLMSKPLNTNYMYRYFVCIKTNTEIFKQKLKTIVYLFLILPIFRSGGPQSSQELTKSLLSWSKIDHKILLL